MNIKKFIDDLRHERFEPIKMAIFSMLFIIIAATGLTIALYTMFPVWGMVFALGVIAFYIIVAIHYTE